MTHFAREFTLREVLDMAWKTPRVLEISIGMEINSYACAEI